MDGSIIGARDPGAAHPVLYVDRIMPFIAAAKRAPANEIHTFVV